MLFRNIRVCMFYLTNSSSVQLGGLISMQSLKQGRLRRMLDYRFTAQGVRGNPHGCTPTGSGEASLDRVSGHNTNSKTM